MNIHFDGGDINNNGYWRLTGVSCLTCRDEVQAYLSPVAMYTVELLCEECDEPFTPAFDAFSDVTV